MAGVPRFTPRAPSSAPGKLRRALGGQIEAEQRFAKERGVEVGKDGRVGITLARDSGLEMTREGLKVSSSVVGEKNRAQMEAINDIDDAPTTAELASKVNELLAALRKSKRLRGL